MEGKVDQFERLLQDSQERVIELEEDVFKIERLERIISNLGKENEGLNGRLVIEGKKYEQMVLHMEGKHKARVETFLKEWSARVDEVKAELEGKFGECDALKVKAEVFPKV